MALPGGEGLTVSYTLEYDNPVLGPPALHAARRARDASASEVAPARTFCLAAEEADALRAAGLGKGATYQNTLVVGDDGVIENTPALARRVRPAQGPRPPGRSLPRRRRPPRPRARLSHGTRREPATRRRRSSVGRSPRRVARPCPRWPPPAMTHNQIRRILPHRYPFLLVDRVLEVEGFQRAVGIKNVTLNEPFFEGHYPDEPIMPGVLIVEAMAQLAGLLLLRKLELTGKVPVLLSIDRVKFRRAVVPGDQLQLEAETMRLSGSRGRVRCRSTRGRAARRGVPPELRPHGGQRGMTCALAPHLEPRRPAGIHPTAVVDPRAELGRRRRRSVRTPSWTGRSSWAGLRAPRPRDRPRAHVARARATTCYPGAVIGAEPQDLKHAGEATHLEIGDRQPVSRARDRARGHAHGRRRHAHRLRRPVHGRLPRGPRLSGRQPGHPREPRAPGRARAGRRRRGPERRERLPPLHAPSAGWPTSAGSRASPRTSTRSRSSRATLRACAARTRSACSGRASNPRP